MNYSTTFLERRIIELYRITLLRTHLVLFTHIISVITSSVYIYKFFNNLNNFYYYNSKIFMGFISDFDYLNIKSYYIINLYKHFNH